MVEIYGVECSGYYLDSQVGYTPRKMHQGIQSVQIISAGKEMEEVTALTYVFTWK